MAMFLVMNADDGGDTAPVPGSTAELFGRLYEQYLPGVFRYVSYRVGDRNTAEDLTSDIFNKALMNFTKYDSKKAAFSTWIFSIARNALIDYYRGRGRRQNLQKEADTDLRASSISPEEEASRLEEIRKLHDCLSLLKPSEQELVSLKFGSEMTNREIAQIMGLSESNVGTILCRVVRKLRDEFRGWQDDG
ncbi:MAG: sigma-70 family RNA polymerase sigma factor [Chloroflexi bacterium]|nr:sigma-70 family RNA polymerase sigma factor [Chloroflexota bacterium]